jgi:8-hydroxy-5-deazaflavin:NADPH oxidoreductase
MTGIAYLNRDLIAAGYVRRRRRSEDVLAGYRALSGGGRCPDVGEFHGDVLVIAVIGTGHIGGGIARQLGAAGHEIRLSFSRDRDSLERLAGEIGSAASIGTPREAVEFGEVIVISVPWNALPEALSEAGSLAGKVVIDTTNQFGAQPLPAEGETAAHFNASRMPGARYTKSFNTLTSGVPGRRSSSAGGRPRRPVAVR